MIIVTALYEVDSLSPSFSQVQSLCKMDGETKRALWPPLVTQAGRMMKKEVECGTAQAPREAVHHGDREAMEGGIRALLGRNPATRWVTNVKNSSDLELLINTKLTELLWL